MPVHFILQVSSILRAEPNSRACGSAKMGLFFFDEDNRVFLNQRMLCLPRTRQYPSELAMTHFLSVCIGPTYQEGWARTQTGMTPQSTRITFSFSQPSRLINCLHATSPIYFSTGNRFPRLLHLPFVFICIQTTLCSHCFNLFK